LEIFATTWTFFPEEHTFQSFDCNKIMMLINHAAALFKFALAKMIDLYSLSQGRQWQQ
jgi:hypothetical protein